MTTSRETPPFDYLELRRTTPNHLIRHDGGPTPLQMMARGDFDLDDYRPGGCRHVYRREWRPRWLVWLLWKYWWRPGVRKPKRQKPRLPY